MYNNKKETTLKDFNFIEKIIKIVTIHEGSSFANVPNDINKIWKGSIVVHDEIAIKGSNCTDAKSKIEKWI